MAKSSSYKKRARRIREGHADPAARRGHWNGLSPVERRTPTQREALERQHRKHVRNRDLQGGDDSFFFCRYASLRASTPLSVKYAHNCSRSSGRNVYPQSNPL